MKKYLGPLSKDNPILVQTLGVCSALAVTAQLKPAVVMALSVTVVCACSNFIISLMRNTIPPRIRIIVQLLVVSFFVILVDLLLQSYLYDVSKMLSVFVGLIITNCIIMGRLEAFALSHKPFPSLMDGLMNGLGYGLVLVVVAFFRELLGPGTLWNHQVVPDSWYAAGYLNNGLMILPPMALILVGGGDYLGERVSRLSEAMRDGTARGGGGASRRDATRRQAQLTPYQRRSRAVW